MHCEENPLLQHIPVHSVQEEEVLSLKVETVCLLVDRTLPPPRPSLHCTENIPLYIISSNHCRLFFVWFNYFRNFSNLTLMVNIINKCWCICVFMCVGGGGSVCVLAVGSMWAYWYTVYNFLNKGRFRIVCIDYFVICIMCSKI